MHPRLHNSALKNLESLTLYNYSTDERYELDPESFEFLRYCTGRHSLEEILVATGSDRTESTEFIDYLQSEGSIEDCYATIAPDRFDIKNPIKPSLRYLQIHITERCNMDCRHCYLGSKESKDLDFELIKKAFVEFSPNGLKALITGGEALLHPRIWEILEIARQYPVRLELLSNGSMITDDLAKRLGEYVHAVQISLDGMKKGHDFLRGAGAYERTVEGIKNAAKHLDVSIATMVHSGNLKEFDELEGFVKNMGVREWNLDIPSLAGNATPEILPDPAEAAEIFRSYGFGEGVHEGDQDYSCGSHICTIHVDGGVSKCGFFEDAVGNIRDQPLDVLWQRVVERYTPKVSELLCADCRVSMECRGGCRYRALVSGDFKGKDPFMCHVQLGEGP